MEEMKSMSSVSVNEKQDERKVYTAPSAELIMLAPQENLALVDNNHIPAKDRWMLGQWNGLFSGCLASGGTTGAVTFGADDGWKLPPTN